MGRNSAICSGAGISDYFDQDEFYGRFIRRELGKVAAIFHQGACSDTMENDGRMMLRNNYRCSKELLDACQSQGVRLLYASSAAVYGSSMTFRETAALRAAARTSMATPSCCSTTSVRRMLAGATSQVAGLRYFNVYGPREQHKGRMASVAFHHFNQYRDTGKVRLFGEYGGYGPGRQSRDFIHVDDVVAVNLWLLAHPECNGVFNLGTGRAQTFNDVAHATVNACRARRGEAPLTLEQQIEQGHGGVHSRFRRP